MARRKKTSVYQLLLVLVPSPRAVRPCHSVYALSRWHSLTVPASLFCWTPHLLRVREPSLPPLQGEPLTNSLPFVAALPRFAAGPGGQVGTVQMWDWLVAVSFWGHLMTPGFLVGVSDHAPLVLSP